ncbi:MAG TPA: hypothetical protein VFE38_12125 [Edaphobacter sp.]|nr:hypothetical protein [Edaphobacter sp.]
MTISKSQLGWSALIGIVSVAALAGIASIDRLDSFGIVLLPGALAAAVFFPQGIESDHGMAFLVLAAIFDVVLFVAIALFVFRMRGKILSRH